METPDCCCRSVTCTVIVPGGVLLDFWAASACNHGAAHSQSDQHFPLRASLQNLSGMLCF